MPTSSPGSLSGLKVVRIASQSLQSRPSSSISRVCQLSSASINWRVSTVYSCKRGGMPSPCALCRMKSRKRSSGISPCKRPCTRATFNSSTAVLTMRVRSSPMTGVIRCGIIVSGSNGRCACCLASSCMLDWRRVMLCFKSGLMMLRKARWFGSNPCSRRGKVRLSAACESLKALKSSVSQRGGDEMRACTVSIGSASRVRRSSSVSASAARRSTKISSCSNAGCSFQRSKRRWACSLSVEGMGELSVFCRGVIRSVSARARYQVACSLSSCPCVPDWTSISFID